MLKNFINNITHKLSTIKKENKNYKQLLKTTTTFQNLFPIQVTNQIPSPHKINTITAECPDINKDKAKLIASLIPVEETFLSIIYAKEIKTNKEYYLIPTDKYLWTIDTKSFGAFTYDTITFQIIKNNIIGKTILLNNILLDITGDNNKINTLITILTNPSERNIIIQSKTNYLCGITPIYQNINNINSGLSIDNQGTVIFHTKDNNYKYHINDILYYEILFDNTVISSNKNNTNITNFNSGAYQISLRITTKDQQSIILPILLPNSFGTKYQRNDTIFQKNFDFTKSITNALDNHLKKLNN